MTACLQRRLDFALAEIERLRYAALAKIELLRTRVAELEAVVLPLDELLSDGEEHTAQRHGPLDYWIDERSDGEGDWWYNGPTLAAALSAAVEAKKGTP